MRGLAPLPILPLLALALVAAAPAPAAENAALAAGADKPPVSTERSQMLWDKGFELPPGSHLRFAKVSEAAGPDGHTLRYRVYAPGAQLATEYSFAMWRIGTSVDDLEVVSESVYVNRRGLLLTNLPNPGQQDADSLSDGSELDVSFTAARGEPVRFILRSADWKTMIGGTVVPYPIESAGKGCRLTALLADPDARSVLIYADGFPPNAVLSAQSASAGQTKQHNLYADASGHAWSVENPHAGSVPAGTLTETVRAAAGCSASVDVPWGRSNYHVQ